MRCNASRVITTTTKNAWTSSTSISTRCARTVPTPEARFGTRKAAKPEQRPEYFPSTTAARAGTSPACICYRSESSGAGPRPANFRKAGRGPHLSKLAFYSKPIWTAYGCDPRPECEPCRLKPAQNPILALFGVAVPFGFAGPAIWTASDYVSDLVFGCRSSPRGINGLACPNCLVPPNLDNCDA